MRVLELAAGTGTPHGYFDPAAIARDVTLGGFHGTISLETVAARSRADTARVPAIALCQGTPLRGELEARGVSLTEVTDHATSALAGRFGTGPVEAKMQAHVVSVTR
jgi:hypothetical protein